MHITRITRWEPAAPGVELMLLEQLTVAGLHHHINRIPSQLVRDSAGSRGWPRSSRGSDPMPPDAPGCPDPDTLCPDSGSTTRPVGKGAGPGTARHGAARHRDTIGQYAHICGRD
jgi:hypothetical protein